MDAQASSLQMLVGLLNTVLANARQVIMCAADFAMLRKHRADLF